MLVRSAESYTYPDGLRPTDFAIQDKTLRTLDRIPSLQRHQSLEQQVLGRHRADAWRNSQRRRRMEGGIRRGILMAAPFMRPATEALARHVEKIDGEPGLIQIPVGFPTLNGDELTNMTKVRTMERGARQCEQTMLTELAKARERGEVYQDPRILPGLPDYARRVGIDELPQLLYDWPERRVDLIGARAFTEPEIERVRLMVEVADDPVSPVEPDSRKILAEYLGKMQQARLKQALFSLYSATHAKELSLTERAYMHGLFADNASPRLDLDIVRFSLWRRGVRRIGGR